MIKKM